MVYDENNNPIGNAEISVSGINHDVTSGMKVVVGGSAVLVLGTCDFLCVCVTSLNVYFILDWSESPI